MKIPSKTLQNRKYVYISDFCLAVFLSAKGIPLCMLKTEGNSSRVSFCFLESEELRKMKLEYINNGNIGVRDFYATYRELKNELYAYLHERKTVN